MFCWMVRVWRSWLSRALATKRRWARGRGAGGRGTGQADSRRTGARRRRAVATSAARDWILGDVGERGAESLKCNCRAYVEEPGVLPLTNTYFGLETDCGLVSLSHGYPVNGSWSSGLNQGQTNTTRQRLKQCHGADVGVPVNETW